MNDDPYLIPGTRVLRNRLGITDQAELDRKERLLVVQRTLEGPPTGNFDLRHLQAIHRHLFQDLYDWAGELRTLEISKGGSQFQFSRFVETGMQDVHRRLVQKSFLAGLPPEAFAKEVGEIIGDVNYVHPFREGNGRTQLEYFRQLGRRAGHHVNPDQLDPAGWQEASRRAMNGDYAAMAAAILHQAMGVRDGEQRVVPETAMRFLSIGSGEQEP